MTGHDDARPAGILVGQAERRLAAAGVATPRLDAEVLLAHALGIARVRLLAEPRLSVNRAAASRFAALVERRAAREPVAYLVGEREFWSLPLSVDRRVLVPRPETEAVVEAALARLEELAAAGARGPLLVVDVGTGSGAIALAIAAELGGGGAAGRDAATGGGWDAVASGARGGARIVAVDRSADALAVARENVRRLGALGSSVLLVRADLLAPFGPGAVDVVVANPPYLSEADLAAVEPELCHEPTSALLGGDGDGLGVVRRLAQEARRALRAGGFLVSEIGATQGAAAAEAARRAGLGGVNIKKDLAGLDRVLVARRADGGTRSDLVAQRWR